MPKVLKLSGRCRCSTWSYMLHFWFFCVDDVNFESVRNVLGISFGRFHQLLPALRGIFMYILISFSRLCLQTRNWKPIAIVKITYKIFAKMLHDRLQPLLEREQSMDQVCFRRGTGIDHALAVFETVCGKSVEWNAEIWFASLDLTKAFDRVEHDQLFQALKEQHVPQPYIALLKAIYSSQTGSVFGGRPFEIQRGVKQGDILSPMLFNAALECALRKWQGKCGHHGIAHGSSRTADKYQVCRWFDVICPFLASFGGDDWNLVMRTTASWTTIECSQKQDIHNKTAGSPHVCWSVAGFGARSPWRGFTQVSWQTYPWELKTTWPCGTSSSRDKRLGKVQQTSDFTYKQTCEFETAIEVLQCVVTPVMLFSLHTLALTKIQLESINVLQRKMLRSIVGWVRMSGEDWSETMRRMNHRNALSKTWTSTCQMGWQTVNPYKTLFPTASCMAYGGQTAIMAKCSAALRFTFCGPLSPYFPHVPMGS